MKASHALGIRALAPHLAGLVVGVTLLLLLSSEWQPPAALTRLGRGGAQTKQQTLGDAAGQAAPRLAPQPQARQPAAGAARASAAACKLDVASPPVWASSCALLTDVCVDQRTIILYGQEYSPRGRRPAKALPRLRPAGKQSDSFTWHYRSGRNRGRLPLPPFEVRPASDAEGPAYLQDPQFSSCTVPILHSPFWLTNFGHTFRDNAAVLFSALRTTPWWPHAKLVVLTPDGLGMPPFAYELYQPLSNFTLETWADFTARLRGPEEAAENAPRAGWPGGPLLPPSWEGTHQRCFRRMFVCTNGIADPALPAYSFGQHAVRYYKQHGWQLQPMVELRQPPGDAAAGAAAVAKAGREGEGDRLLRIVFQKRAPGHPGREILNIGELLRRCNGWRFKLGGRWLRAQCAEIEFSDLRTGMAAAQAADIIVGPHGAQQANGWLMRSGGAIVEIQAWEFELVPEHLQHPERNMLDPATQVQWYVLMACDPQDSSPSEIELARHGHKAEWVKARSVRLRWDALEAALRTAAGAAGNMQRYRRLWQQGRWWWHVLPKGGLRYGGLDRRAACPGVKLPG